MTHCRSFALEARCHQRTIGPKQVVFHAVRAGMRGSTRGPLSPCPSPGLNHRQHVSHRCIEANLEAKETVIGRLEVPDIKLKRFRADDDLMNFLETPQRCEVRHAPARLTIQEPPMRALQRRMVATDASRSTAGVRPHRKLCREKMPRATTASLTQSRVDRFRRFLQRRRLALYLLELCVHASPSWRARRPDIGARRDRRRVVQRAGSHHRVLWPAG